MTAFAALANDLPLTWVAATLTPDDREAFPTAETSARRVRLGRQSLDVRYVPVSEEVHRWHYDEVSNNILWFLQHYLWDVANSPNFTEAQYRYWDEGYRTLNEAIAQAVAEEASAGMHGRRRTTPKDGSNAIVLLQDYHLYVAPQMVRTRLPRSTVQQFIHIPWPAFRYWEFLPERLVLEIFEGLTSNDVLGFQTPLDVRNFLFGAHQFLSGSRVDFERGTVHWRRHRLQARAYPIPVDAGEVRHELLSAAGRRGAEELAPLLGDDMTILVRVDRLDPTKNVVRGFRAYETLLDRYPELHGHVRFLAFLVPSRQDLPVYKRYDREVRGIIRRINARFGNDTWQPITAYFENNRPRALAAMRRADVLVVNPVIDGMNLVAKEGAAVNERDGVIVLSRTAGAYIQMADCVLPVTPTDIEETCDQMYEALRMSERERHERAERAREIAESETPADWVAAQLADLARVRPLGRGATRPEAWSRAG